MSALYSLESSYASFTDPHSAPPLINQYPEVYCYYDCCIKKILKYDTVKLGYHCTNCNTTLNFAHAFASASEDCRKMFLKSCEECHYPMYLVDRQKCSYCDLSLRELAAKLDNISKENKKVLEVKIDIKPALPVLVSQPVSGIDNIKLLHPEISNNDDIELGLSNKTVPNIISDEDLTTMAGTINDYASAIVLLVNNTIVCSNNGYRMIWYRKLNSNGKYEACCNNDAAKNDCINLLESRLASLLRSQIKHSGINPDPNSIERQRIINTHNHITRLTQSEIRDKISQKLTTLLFVANFNPNAITQLSSLNEIKDSKDSNLQPMAPPLMARAATVGSFNNNNSDVRLNHKEYSLLQQKYSPKWLVSRSKMINCNIHGRIVMSNLACLILDTGYFQKLDNQSQLAFCKKVYPTATHTRKEHSIGTYYLTKQIITNIRKNSTSSELQECMTAVSLRFGITENDNKLTDLICELVACCGLAHDLGHGPFSHQFDGVMAAYGLTDTIKYPNIEHEFRSGNILKCILKDVLPAGYIALMQSIIMADGTGFLYEIVSNELNGIDCDKFDYLTRDSNGLGVPISFDHRRLIMDAAVVEGNVCYPFQEREQLCEMFRSRAKLFNNAYAHPSTIACNTMMTDAMYNLPIDDLIESIKTGDMEVFCKYDDARIITRLCDDTGNAGKMWQRIVKYELYHSVGEIRLQVQISNCKQGEEAANASLKLRIDAIQEVWNGMYPGRESEFTISVSKVGYLSGKRTNPLDILPLYSLGKDGVKSRQRISHDEITTLMPKHHQEHLIIMLWKGIGDKTPYVERFKTLKTALKWP